MPTAAEAFRDDALAAHAASASVLGEVFYFLGRPFTGIAGEPADASRVGDTEIGREHDLVVIVAIADLTRLPKRGEVLENEARDCIFPIMDVVVKQPFARLLVKEAFAKT